MTQKRSITVIHFEDEPWVLTYILTDLREVIMDIIGDGAPDSGGCRLDLGPRAPKSYPSRNQLAWNEDGVDHEIIYWFLENIEQLTCDNEVLKKELSQACTFIIDVIRPNGQGKNISTWRETLAAIQGRVVDVNNQVRLYTHFEVNSPDEREMASLSPSLRDLNPPPRITKGDVELLNFLLRRLKG